MGNFRLGRSGRGLGVVIGMYMLLNISLVGCMGKLTFLAFFARIDFKVFIQGQS